MSFSVSLAEVGAPISLDVVAVHPDCRCVCLCYLDFAPENPEDCEMCLLVPGHSGCPGQSPQSRKMDVCVCVCVCVVCLSACMYVFLLVSLSIHISLKHTSELHKFSVHVVRGLGLILLWCCYNTLCTSGGFCG